MDRPPPLHASLAAMDSAEALTLLSDLESDRVERTVF